MLEGIDVSDCQGFINWKKVKDSGISFAFCKATDGLCFVAKTFKYNWKSMKDVGLIRGAYHFCHTKNNPIMEAMHFVKTVGQLDKSDMLVLDIEDDKNTLSSDEFLNWTYTFLSNVENNSGVTPIVYTGGPYFDKNGGKPNKEWIDRLSRFPLWLAAYSTNPDKYIPMIWKKNGWTIWQRSGDQAPKGEKPLRVLGINCVVDRNQYKNTIEDLCKFACNLHNESKPIKIDLIPIDLQNNTNVIDNAIDEPLPVLNFWDNLLQFLQKTFGIK